LSPASIRLPSSLKIADGLDECGGVSAAVGIRLYLLLHDVEWSRGAFMIIDRRTANPIARLPPIPETDRFELFYWSNVKGDGPPSETSAA
jgi:hypothetical protein